MNKLYQIAAEACKDVYQNNIDLGTTEYNLKIKGDLQVLSIAGSNELEDWGKNFNLLSWEGIKYPAYKAAIEIYNDIKDILTEQRILVCGHSKAAPTAIAYKRLFGAWYCCAFNPARSLRYWANRKMDNTTLFINKHDPVSKVGCINFGHPICEIVYSDTGSNVVECHDIGQWID